jgi:hypothetical protein
LKCSDQLIIEIGETQTVIVTAAGNGGTKEDPSLDINSYPALFGRNSDSSDLEHIAELIVAGATNEQGFKARISRVDSFTDFIYAPGENILIPDGSGKDTKPRSGTSFGKWSPGLLHLTISRYLMIIT